MFKVEINNLKIYAKIGISNNERKNKQLLKVSLSFNYSIANNKNTDDIKNLKDYSKITKFLKNYINKSNFKTLEKLIESTAKDINKQFKIKNVKIKIDKTKVAKKYGSDSLSVSN
tara:strand:+ start:104 stop:448 length:345 start_codon:yes stop_codon:yes gene_type:complete